MARIAGVDIPRRSARLSHLHLRHRSHRVPADLRHRQDRPVHPVPGPDRRRVTSSIGDRRGLKVEGDLRRESTRTSSARWRSAATRGPPLSRPAGQESTHPHQRRTRKSPKKTVAGKKEGPRKWQSHRPGPSSPEEGTQARHPRRRSHQKLVQQHDHLDHRPRGQRLAWASAGNAGFKGSRKSTLFAAQLAPSRPPGGHGARRRKVDIVVRSAGAETAIRSIQNVGIEVTGIKDVTPCRTTAAVPKRRRL